MRKREFISLIAGATAWPLTARAQQSAMPVIGYLSEVPGVARLNAAFQRGMAELGYVEGKNFATEYRVNPESLPQAAADLVRRNVNVIFATAPAAVAAVSKATTKHSCRWTRFGERSRCEGLCQEPCAPRRQYHRNFSRYPGVVRQAADAAQGNRSPAVSHSNLWRPRPQRAAIRSDYHGGAGGRD
jgi:hypothetical protein